jgi:hypothetical protein
MVIGITHALYYWFPTSSGESHRDQLADYTYETNLSPTTSDPTRNPKTFVKSLTNPAYPASTPPSTSTNTSSSPPSSPLSTLSEIRGCYHQFQIFFVILC